MGWIYTIDDKDLVGMWHVSLYRQVSLCSNQVHRHCRQVTIQVMWIFNGWSF